MVFHKKKQYLCTQFLEHIKHHKMSKPELITFVESQVARKEFPSFKAGDTITVKYKIVEGNKERIQSFNGVVLQRSGSSSTETFTVRKVSGATAVERIFPFASPFIESVEVNKRGVVRRARIFYLRGLRGKKARIREKRK
jgi:large subunit ribosomal protein L19